MPFPRQNRPHAGQRLTAKTLRRLMEVSEGTDYIGPLPESRTSSAPSFYAQIVETGPNGEDDFTDSTYWIRSVQLSDGGSGVEWELDDSVSGVWYWASNVLEIEDGTHTLEPGQVVDVWVGSTKQGRVALSFNPGGGGGEGLTRQCVLWKAIANTEDVNSQEELNDFNEFGPHLRVIRRRPSGFDSQPIVVFPNYQRSVSDFKKRDGTQIYSPGDPLQDRAVMMIERSERGLVATLGQAQVWKRLPDCLCPPAECGEVQEFGACCLPSGQCVSTTEAQCTEQDGQFFGAGSSCADVECSVDMGACCLPAGGGCTVVSQQTCEDLDGEYFGDGTNCLDAECETLGTCCNVITGQCELLLEEQCTGPGWTWLGPGNNCEQCQADPVGACCNTDTGVCQSNIRESECSQTWLGEGSTCDQCECSNPQECVGTCCLPMGDPCNPNCGAAELTQEQCVAIGGTFMGVGAPINMCQQFGCCFWNDGSTSNEQCAGCAAIICAGIGSSFGGPGSSCPPGPTNPSSGPSQAPQRNQGFLQRMIGMIRG